MYAIFRPFFPALFSAAAVLVSYFAGQQIERLKNAQSQELRIAAEKATAREALRRMEAQTTTIGTQYETTLNQTKLTQQTALDRWLAGAVPVATSELRPTHPQSGNGEPAPATSACSAYASTAQRLVDDHGTRAIRFAGEAQSLAAQLSAAQTYISQVCQPAPAKGKE